MKAIGNILLNANPVGLLLSGFTWLFGAEITPRPEDQRKKPIELHTGEAVLTPRQAQGGDGSDMNCVSCGALTKPYVACEHCGRVNTASGFTRRPCMCGRTTPCKDCLTLV